MKYQRYIWGIAALLWMVAALLAGARTTQATPTGVTYTNTAGCVLAAQHE